MIGKKILSGKKETDLYDYQFYIPNKQLGEVVYSGGAALKRNLFKPILSIIILSFCITFNAFAEQEISLKINGENSKIKPIVVNGSAMLPLRYILNVVGFDSLESKNIYGYDSKRQYDNKINAGQKEVGC